MIDLSRCTAIARAAANAPDTDLLALGDRLCEAWAVERAAYDRNACSNEKEHLADACAEIVEEIIATRATTLAGLQVKAAAVEWCCAGEPFAEENDTTDNRAVAALLADLQAMSADGGAESVIPQRSAQ